MSERAEATHIEASRIEAGVAALGTAGFSVSPGLLPFRLVTTLIAEQRRREKAGELSNAGTGRGGAPQDASQRHVQSSWLNGTSDAEHQFMAFAERLRLAINQRLMLGLFDFEAQFLLYPPGGFYRRHVDALHGDRGRVVSLVAYLNPDWLATEGGALAVWPAGGEGEPIALVAPLAGTVVLMLSEDIPHEARVASRQRRAIAGWFSINTSTADRTDPAR
jgi:SM-20-related protein